MKKIKVKCPMCHGDKGYVEPILDDGSGPFFQCSLCKGTGLVSQSKKMQYVRSFIFEHSAEKK